MIIVYNNNGIVKDLLQGNASLYGCKFNYIYLSHNSDMLTLEEFITFMKAQKGKYIADIEGIDVDELKNVIYKKRYDEINKKTQELIYAGMDYTYDNSTVHFNFDQFNQLEFTALKIKAATLTYPYTVWEGNDSLSFVNQTDLEDFLDAVFDFIQSKKTEGKTLRDSLLSMSLADLIAFTDSR